MSKGEWCVQLAKLVIAFVFAFLFFQWAERVIDLLTLIAANAH